MWCLLTRILNAVRLFRIYIFLIIFCLNQEFVNISSLLLLGRNHRKKTAPISTIVEAGYVEEGDLLRYKVRRISGVYYPQIILLVEDDLELLCI